MSASPTHSLVSRANPDVHANGWCLQVVKVHMAAGVDTWIGGIVVPPGEVAHFAHIFIARFLCLAFLYPVAVCFIVVPERHVVWCTGNNGWINGNADFNLLAGSYIEFLSVGGVQLHPYHTEGG